MSRIISQIPVPRIPVIVLAICAGVSLGLLAAPVRADEAPGGREQRLEYAQNLLAEGRGYQNAGRFDQAAAAMDEGLAALATVFDDDNSIVAAALHDRARLYVSQNRPEDAARLFERALEIRETKLGSDSLYTRDTRDALASLYEAEGRGRDAATLRARLDAPGG